jgi:hypothetical protein
MIISERSGKVENVPRKMNSPLLLDAVELYRGGLSFREASIKTGLGTQVIKRAVKEAGINRTLHEALLLKGAKMRGKKTAPQLPLDEIKRRYLAGESTTDIAKTYNVGYGAILRRLRQQGVRIRTLAEAGKLVREESRARRAKSIIPKVGLGEELLAKWLRQLGEVPVIQQAVGTRNVDIALWPLAVEVWLSSSSPLSDPYCRQRIKYLADRGWSSCYVFMARRTGILLPTVADKIISLRDQALLNPTAARQHWVIRGCGELAAAVGDDLDHGPLIPVSMGCPYHGSGNYRFPR